MYLNQEERGFVDYYTLKYEKFATGIGRYSRNRNEQFLTNCLKVYYRLFGDNIDFNKFCDVVDCTDKCRLYVEQYENMIPVSMSDAKDKQFVCKYFKIVCDDKDNYHKMFAHVLNFVYDGHMI